jgi:hypothetical protein
VWREGGRDGVYPAQRKQYKLKARLILKYKINTVTVVTEKEDRVELVT